MRIKLSSKFLLGSMILASCIGTDVLEVELVPRELRITNVVESLAVGDTASFSATYFNEMGAVEQVMVQWQSLNPSVLSLDAQGLARGESLGLATVIAIYENLSDTALVSVSEQTVFGPNERGGTFMGKGSYTVEGNFLLKGSSPGLTLKFEDNFKASNGPGLYVYLSNADNSVSGGVELGELISNTGAQEYEVPFQVELATYDYVIIYCKPFGVPFGYGKFNE